MNLKSNLRLVLEKITTYNNRYGKKQIGTVFDIPVYLTASWVVITTLFIYQLYTNPTVLEAYTVFTPEIFNYSIPTTTTYILIFSITIPLSVYISIFLHELGHAAVAQHFGIPVEGIKMFILGGIAQIQRIPENPIEEFLVAVAGPIITTSIILLMIPLTLFFQSINAIFISTLTFFILTMNLFILGLNLVPTYPLDGGRILHSILTYTQSLKEGTIQAVTITKISAVIAGITGIALGNPVIALFGLFIYSTAKREQKQLLCDEKNNTNILQDKIPNSTIVLDDTLNLTRLRIKTVNETQQVNSKTTPKTINTDDLTVTGKELIENIITENNGELQPNIDKFTDYIITSTDNKELYSTHRDQYNINIITITELISDADNLVNYENT